MKTLALTIASFLTIMISSQVITYAQGGDKLNPGDMLPAMDVQMKSASGSATTLKEAAKANGLLVMFSCNTCPFVIKNQPVTKEVMDYANAHNIGMVIINSNEAQRGDQDSY